MVMRAYGEILRGTGSYLRLAFTPFLIAILPITFLIVQLDRYFGWMPLQPAQTFLVEARVDDPAALQRGRAAIASGIGRARLRPSTFRMDKEVVWRVVAQREGQYDIHIAAAGQTVSKQVVVSPGLARISPVRLRDNFWERMFTSASRRWRIIVRSSRSQLSYPPRVINFAWMEWNWIVLFFVVSLIAGFIFKSCSGNSGMKLHPCPQKRLGAWCRVRC